MTRLFVWLLGTAALTVVTVGIVWLWSARLGISIEGHALAALIIGLAATSGLAIALMNLMYWSNRRGLDESVHHPSGKAPSPPADPS